MRLETTHKRGIYMKFYLFSLTILGLALVKNVYATTFEYKEVLRTYIDLSTVNTTECKSSFRLIHSNYMDCSLHLPNPGIDSLISQITPANYQIENFNLKTPKSRYQFYIDLRDNDESGLWISGYYQLPGNFDIQQRQEKYYSFSIHVLVINYRASISE